jgi:hypothetical protein
MQHGFPGVQARVAAAVALDMPPEELETYLKMWSLQPFTDEDAVNALRASEGK